MTLCQILVLPSGSALVAVAAFQTIFFVVQIIVEAGYYTKAVSLGFNDSYNLSVDASQIFGTILYWIFIFRRTKLSALLWVFVYFISSFFKFYLLSRQLSHSPSFTWIFTALILIHVGIFTLSGHLIINIFHNGGEHEDSRPIGRSVSFFWRFYKHENPDIAIKLVLLVELAWSAISLFVFQVPTQFLNLEFIGHSQSAMEEGSRGYTLTNIEEFYIRAIRVILGIIGLRIFGNKSTKAMRMWVMASLALIICSGCLYYFIFDYNVRRSMEEMKTSYQCLFTLDLLFRFVIMYYAVNFIEFLNVDLRRTQCVQML